MSMTWHVEIIFITEFQSKGNDDMIQCVTCNKFSLFASRLNSLKKGKKKYPCGTRIYFECFQNEKHYSILYEIDL